MVIYMVGTLVTVKDISIFGLSHCRAGARAADNIEKLFNFAVPGNGAVNRRRKTALTEREE